MWKKYKKFDVEINFSPEKKYKKFDVVENFSIEKKS